MDTIPALECHRYLGARASPVRGLVPRRRGLFFLLVSFFPSFAGGTAVRGLVPRRLVYLLFFNKKNQTESHVASPKGLRKAIPTITEKMYW
jgi:hypothetical protein